ncbi:MAG TPA: hypothetical protein VEK10_11610 [Steroidobacteraceae bacterium]|nr:hypothetical protein [Steroidobacteraceae bacterium]
MKLTSLALAAALAVAGYAQAQTAAPSSPPASAPAASSDSSGKIDHACKGEIHKLCGHAHGQEMQDCVKSGLDMNKFSASCTSEIKAKGAKSSASSSKPST